MNASQCISEALWKAGIMPLTQASATGAIIARELDLPGLREKAAALRGSITGEWIGRNQTAVGTDELSSLLEAITALTKERPVAEVEAPKGLEDVLTKLLCHAEQNECAHEVTHRGGVLWTICDGCGKQWADDEGGMPVYVEPAAITAAHKALDALATARKEKQP